MKKLGFPVVCILALVVLLASSSGPVLAGDADPAGEQEQNTVQEDVRNYFPIQGRLTDDSGNPLNGDFDIAFRLYDVLEGGEALCSDTNLVAVVNGLFSSEIYGTCMGHITGQQLFLSIEIETDGEMTPRQPIYAVPYAWSLRPGAIIIGTVGPDAMLHIENDDPNGRGLRAYATSPTGKNYGIVGASNSPSGFGGYFYNNDGGVGLRAESNTNAAIQATGSGIIKSSAKSYVWISGSGFRPYNHTDTTLIDMDTVGGAIITRGAATGRRNVMLPITITGPLYGQNVTVTGLDIYFSGGTAADAIYAILLRRQKYVCAADDCFDTLLPDFVLHPCAVGANPHGCSLHFDITDANVISVDSGILYLTVELTFSGAAGWVDIGGVRLTLEHD